MVTDTIQRYFKDSHTLFYHSSDEHAGIEGDTYLRYELIGKRVRLWFGGENGEVCLIITESETKLENIIRELIFP